MFAVDSKKLKALREVSGSDLRLECTCRRVYAYIKDERKKEWMH